MHGEPLTIYITYDIFSYYIILNKLSKRTIFTFKNMSNRIDNVVLCFLLFCVHVAIVSAKSNVRHNPFQYYHNICCNSCLLFLYNLIIYCLLVAKPWWRFIQPKIRGQRIQNQSENGS